MLRVRQPCQRMYRGAHAVQRIHTGDPSDHLLLQERPLSDVVGASPLAELRDRLGTQPLACLAVTGRTAGISMFSARCSCWSSCHAWWMTWRVMSPP
ncbi:hypothetical protein LK06_002945 [Streptomyces pluripotens]|nr:hypothetical protein LK06_002945 [Streptomyces pluripotens]